MVIVLGERKLELTLAVVRNYSVPQLQPANLPKAGLRKWGQGSSRTGFNVYDRPHDLLVTETV